MVNTQIQEKQNKLNGVENPSSDGRLPENDEPAPETNGNTTNDSDEEVTITTTFAGTNPFMAISSDTASYLNMTQALQAIANTNNLKIQSAQNQVQANQTNARNMFQTFMRK